MTVQELRPAGQDAIPEAEWQTRIDLAAAYQLAEHLGWSQLTWNHISAQVPGNEAHFLMNQQGLLYDEVTASNLVKVDIDGRLLAGADDTSPAGFVIHSAVHLAREDVVCVMHSHTPEGVAVSCLEDGLPQLCGETAYFHNDIGYHDYEGVSLGLDERARIARSLGDKSTLILRNHGLLTVGRSVSEAFMRMYWLIYCCKVLAALTAMGQPFRRLPEGLADTAAAQDAEVAPPGQFEWQALLRRLERIAPRYKT